MPQYPGPTGQPSQQPEPEKPPKQPRKFQLNYTAYFLFAIIALLLAVVTWHRLWIVGIIWLVGAGVLVYYGYKDYQGRS